MVKLIIKDRIKFFALFIIIFAFGVFFAFSNDTKDIDLISLNTSSNFIVFILNNLYIIYIYTKTKNTKSIYDKLVCRLGRKKVICSYIINSIIDVICFCFITDFILYLKFGINYDYINFFIVFIICRFIVFMIFELMSLFLFNNKNSTRYILVPIILNLLFYKFFVEMLIYIMLGQM